MLTWSSAHWAWRDEPQMERHEEPGTGVSLKNAKVARVPPSTACRNKCISCKMMPPLHDSLVSDLDGEFAEPFPCRSCAQLRAVNACANHTSDATGSGKEHPQPSPLCRSTNPDQLGSRRWCSLQIDTQGRGSQGIVLQLPTLALLRPATTN